MLDAAHVCRALRCWGLVAACAGIDGGCGGGDAGGYGFETGPTMRPGENCRRCHGSPTTDYPAAPEWTAAGTIYPGPDSPTTDGVPGVTVLLMQPDGQSVLETLSTNEVGNFYTSTALPEGFRVALEYEGERVEMPCAVPSGGCGACHTQPPIGTAPGRIFIPQAPETQSLDPICDGF